MTPKLARVTMVLAAGMLIVAVLATAQSKDPFVGTWRLNLAKSNELVSKKNGKVTQSQRNVVAADGKTRTVTTTGTDAQGQKVNNVAVYDKQ